MTVGNFRNWVSVRVVSPPRQKYAGQSPGWLQILEKCKVRHWSTIYCYNYILFRESAASYFKSWNGIPTNTQIDNVNRRSPLLLHCREQCKTKICAKLNGCLQIPASPQISHSHKNFLQLSHWELNRDSVWQKTQLVTKHVTSYSLLYSLHKNIHRFSLSVTVSVKPQILAWLVCRNRLQGSERYQCWIICRRLILISAVYIPVWEGQKKDTRIWW